jgi:hypothetical protein
MGLAQVAYNLSGHSPRSNNTATRDAESSNRPPRRRRDGEHYCGNQGRVAEGFHRKILAEKREPAEFSSLTALGTKQAHNARAYT